MGYTASRMTRSLDGLTTLLEGAGLARTGTGGAIVTNNTVGGIPAITSAVEFASEAVAQLTMGVVTGTTPAIPADGWQARLFNNGPSSAQGRFEFWHTVQASIEWRNIAYVWKTKVGGRVDSLTALHPDQVSVRYDGSAVQFRVVFAKGYPLPPEVDSFGSTTVGLERIIRIPGRGSAGELVPLTPIQRFRKALGLAVGKQEHEASFLANGAGYGLLVSFPPGTKQEDADMWRERFDAGHAGPTKAGRTKVVGGGATVSNISMTQADAQFAESVQLSLHDVCLIQHVPLWLMGMPASKSAIMVNPEHEMQRWNYFYLGPRLSRIESAFNADPDLFGLGALRCRFETVDIVRGDMQTEDTIAHNRVQDGRLLVDEWRLAHGLPPLPGGVGMIPQITPVGGAPNAVTPPAQSPQDDDEE